MFHWIWIIYRSIIEKLRDGKITTDEFLSLHELLRLVPKGYQKFDHDRNNKIKDQKGAPKSAHEHHVKGSK